MKIKRTKVGPNSGKNDTSKQDAAHKGDSAGGGSTSQHPSTGVHAVNGVPSGGGSGGAGLEGSKPGASGGGTPTKGGTAALASDSSKDKSPKVKAQMAKKEKNKEKSGGSGGTGGGVSKTQGDGGGNPVLLSNGSTTVGSTSSGSSSSSGSSNSSGGCGGGSVAGVANGLDMYPQITMEPRVAVEAVSVKRDVIRPVLDDPYEFNAKVEDGFGLPPKKLKTESKVSIRKKNPKVWSCLICQVCLMLFERLNGVAGITYHSVSLCDIYVWAMCYVSKVYGTIVNFTC